MVLHLGMPLHHPRHYPCRISSYTKRLWKEEEEKEEEKKEK
jgi:hypothetical protein